MYLSGKIEPTRIQWMLSTEKAFPPNYMPPAKGFIIPSPGVLFRGTYLSDEFCREVRGSTLSDLHDLGIDFCTDGEVLHFSLLGEALCDSKIYKPIIEPGDLHVCMECQYNFWRQRG